MEPEVATQLSLEADAEIDVLEGWTSLPGAAKVLGVSRQYAYKMAKQKKFKTLKRIEDSNYILVSTKELDQMVASRAESEDS